MLPSKFEYWQGRSEREHPIGPHSNLWGAAYVVFILMTLGDEYVWDKVVQAEIDEHEIHQQIRMQGFDRRRSSGQYQLFDDVPTSLPQVEEHGIADNYSERLRDLVLRCTRLRPQDRPDRHDGRIGSTR